MKNNNILVVDLDESLLRIDLFKESFIRLFFSKPLIFLEAFYILLKSLKLSKIFVSENSQIDYQHLPYDRRVISTIKEYRKKGYKIILSTGTPEIFANGVADNLDLFNQIIATNKQTNNVGKDKLNNVIKLGYKNFIYVGNSTKDIPIWEYCKKAIVVSNDNSLFKKLKNLDVEIIENIKVEKPLFRNTFKQIRIIQWSKNSLLFLPGIVSHQILSSTIFFNTIMAFFSFSFIASFVYVVNDLIDVNNDRNHHSKKHRPIARGSLLAQDAFLIAWISLSLGFFVAFNLSSIFLSILLIYLTCTFLYTNYFKKIVLVDVLFLVAFYTLRLLAGHVVTDIELSTWLLSFSIFTFFSLGLLKRYIDLASLDKNSKINVRGRGYKSRDKDFILIIGVCSGLLSSLVLLLYIGSDQVVKLYSNPILLILTIPLYLYWISWIWITAFRDKMESDPVIFAVKNKNIYAIFVIFILIMALSK